MTTTATESFLIDQFREFYTEVVYLKQRVGMDTWIYAGDEGEAGDEAAESWSPTAVWQRLLGALQRQGLQARRKGGEFGEEFYREAQYVMAALADDTFLHLPWKGSESWKANLLESKLFRTHHAGEAMFRRLDEVLAGRDPVHLDLAKIYLLSLSLGFQGKYRDSPDGPRKLMGYRHDLLDFIAERDPQFAAGTTKMFPEAYASTIDQGKGVRLPYLRRWLMAFPVVLLLWIAGGWLLWNHLLTDLEPVVDRVLNLR